MYNENRTINMTMSIEVRMERMDSKLEKHIGITETILKNQEDTLEKILNIIKEHSDKFISKDEAELMELASQAKTSHEIDVKLTGFESRIDKKYTKIFGAVVITAATLFGFIEIIPLIKGGS